MNDNLKYGKLEGIKTLGVVFGTFAPAHKGHYSIIARASMENDETLVVVSGRKGDRGEAVDLPLERRFRYMREVVAQEGNVSVEKLDEADIPPMPEGWDQWLGMMMHVIKNAVKDFESLERIMWYVGKEEYITEITKRLPTPLHQVTMIDRSKIDISSFKIRREPRMNWRYILKPFRRSFTKKVLVCGTASSGKTTLVRKLATLYGTAHSEEYSRTYQQVNNVRDNELDPNDYLYLATGQFENNKSAIWSDGNTGIVFCDTDVLVTEMYARADFGTGYDKSVFDRLMSKEQWDIIFVIPPITEYVDDGYRNMEQADLSYRLEMHNTLLSLIKEYKLDDKIIFLDATDANGGYYARFVQAQNYIFEMFKSLL